MFRIEHWKISFRNCSRQQVSFCRISELPFPSKMPTEEEKVNNAIKMPKYAPRNSLRKFSQQENLSTGNAKQIKRDFPSDRFGWRSFSFMIFYPLLPLGSCTYIPLLITPVVCNMHSILSSLKSNTYLMIINNNQDDTKLIYWCEFTLPTLLSVIRSRFHSIPRA